MALPMREIRVDLESIVNNYKILKDIASPAQVMAVIKANAYGHGMIPVAKALKKANVDALGVADICKAFQLRSDGIDGRIFCWMLLPDSDFARAIAENIELGISHFDTLNMVVKAGVATVHVKVDTGLGRNGFSECDWAALFAKLSELMSEGKLRVQGIFSHLSNTSEADDLQQHDSFERALKLAAEYGVVFPERHLAASAGMMSYPQMRYDMVRCGIAMYGLNPWDDRPCTQMALRPAMRVSCRVINVKRVPAGQGVSYGYRYRTHSETTLCLVPMELR